MSEGKSFWPRAQANKELVNVMMGKSRKKGIHEISCEADQTGGNEQGGQSDVGPDLRIR